MASPIAVAKKQASEMARLAEAMTSTAEATAEITAVLEKIETRLAAIEAGYAEIVSSLNPAVDAKPTRARSSK